MLNNSTNGIKDTRPSHPEILAPAGDIESVYAAIQNGANAVYLGQQAFSARQNAKNFDREGLSHAVSYCHSRGAKVYQTLNTIIFDGQWQELLDCIKTACDCGVDALIVQDWGVMAAIKHAAPNMPIHGSTQMSVHSRRGAELLKELGLSRVVLARELSKEEIADITQNVDIEAEVFVQGALCMSVSGQCYVSGMIGGRSGNRGSCAGTCRLPFSAGKIGDYGLSLKDLCLADRVHELAEIGVTSLKIEGRMKRPEYAAAASKLYSMALNDGDYDIDIIQSVFSRSGFTEGYYINSTPSERFGIRSREDVTAATEPLLKSLRNTYQKEAGHITANAVFTLKRGKPSKLTLSDNDNNTVTAEGEIPQEAINRPTTEEAARANIFKLGGTIFIGGEFKADIEDGLMLPASAINSLRRDASERLQREREKIIPVACDITAAQPIAKKPKAGKAIENPLSNGLRVRFSTVNQVVALSSEVLYSIAAFSVPLWELDRLNPGELERLFIYREKLIIEPERFIAGREDIAIKSLQKLRDYGFFRLLCNNAAHIRLAKEVGFIPHGGVFLNAANKYAVSALSEMGLADIQLSFELKLQDAVGIANSGILPCISVVYGYLPLMLLRTCPMRKQASCADCANSKKKDGYFSPPTLTDRLGKRFPITCVNKLYSELLNCQPLWMLDRLNEASPAGAPLLYFTYETPSDVQKVIKAFHDGAAPEGEFTRGLYYRSV